MLAAGSCGPTLTRQLRNLRLDSAQTGVCGRDCLK
jgi:hypothetical protein